MSYWTRKKRKMIMHSAVHVPAQCRVEPPIIKPFMWRSTTGCIYLRNDCAQDLIVGPRICDEKLGKVTAPYTSDAEAWARRLPPGSTVTLTQTE